jgi:hypothetical protein
MAFSCPSTGQFVKKKLNSPGENSGTRLANSRSRLKFVVRWSLERIGLVKPQIPPSPTLLERVLSALWIAVITALAIPALLAAFSRDTARPIHLAPPNDTKTVEVLEIEDLGRNVNANAPSGAVNR